MGEKTGISWTDATWNPWIGCIKVSAGCKNCYMFREQEHYGGDPNIIHKTSAHTFNMPLRLKEPKRIFICSWSDFFIREADPWRNDAWNIVRKTKHIYQIPTKRPENIDGRLPQFWGEIRDRVILIVSTENQEMYNLRVSILIKEMMGAKLGISVEPMLGQIIFNPYDRIYLNWVIAGGESGAKDKVRMDNLDWYRSLRDQCEPFGIPFFLKQAWIDGKLVKEPFLDGRQWLEFPT